MRHERASTVPRAVLLLGLCLVACNGTTEVPAGDLPVASVLLQPDSLALGLGRTAQLQVSLVDAGGGVLTGRQVDWTTSDAAVATVNASGLVTGAGAGAAEISATSEGVTGSAKVTVTPVVVTSVTVSPATASIGAGAVVQLTATVRDSAGNALDGRAVAWESGNAAVATVSATGLVTGVADGAVTITAVSEGRSGTAAITVTGGIPAAECANPPASWVFCDDFESGNLSKWEDVTRVTLTSDAAHVRNGSHALQLFYPQGDDGAGWAWKKQLTPDRADRHVLHVRWWQMWEPDFEWKSGTDGDQKIFLLQGLEPQTAWGQTASWKLYVHLVGDERAGEGVARDELFLERFIWDGTSQWSGQWAGFRQNVTKTSYRRGAWECTEIGMVHNTPGQGDGELRMWINGQLVLEYTGVKFRDEAVSWNALQLDGWFNGIPRDQYSWIDQVVVATERIGC